MVVWSHTQSYSFELWSNGTFGNITFFFLSGFFFKVNAPFGEFLSKRVWRLLLPFLLFYVLSIPFRYVTDLWDYRLFDVFDWNRIWDIFKVEARSDYLSLNVPLWFLLTIFWIHLYGFFLMRLPKWAVLFTGLAAICFGFYCSSWPTPLMVNNACYFYGYFAIGYVIGKPLLRLLAENKWRIVVLFGGLIVSIVLGLVSIYLQGSELGDVSKRFYYLSITVSCLALSSFAEGLKVSEWLRFYGESSLFILGSHLFFLNPLSRVSYKLTRMYDPLLGLACTLLTALMLVPVIRYANKKWPMLTGDWKPVRCKEGSAGKSVIVD